MSDKADEILNNQGLIEKLELEDLKALLSHFKEQKD
jgi:hypothetical protein